MVRQGSAAPLQHVAGLVQHDMVTDTHTQHLPLAAAHCSISGRSSSAFICIADDNDRGYGHHYNHEYGRGFYGDEHGKYHHHGGSAAAAASSG